MASDFINKAYNNVKDTSNLLSDLIRIVLEYLRYQLSVTLTEEDIGLASDEHINSTNYISILKTFESGIIYSTNIIPSYPLVCLHVISLKTSTEIAELTALVCQPLFIYKNEKWSLGSDRCLIDKKIPKINRKHSNGCYYPYKYCHSPCICGKESEERIRSDKILEDEQLTNKINKYEVRLVTHSFYIKQYDTKLPDSETIRWSSNDRYFIYQHPLQDERQD